MDDSTAQARKALVRASGRQARRALSPPTRLAHSAAIATLVAGLPELEAATTVLVYGSMPEEVDTRPLIDACFELGIMGIEIPEQHGGAGATFFMSVLAVEELARVDASIAVLVDVQNTLVNNAVLRWANDEQKRRWLPRLAADTVGAYALSEAQAGSDAFALAARATVLIPVEDDYTFGFNSDDGARLRIIGAVFKSSSFVGDTNNPNRAVPAHRRAAPAQRRRCAAEVLL